MSSDLNHDPELLDALRLSLTRGLGPIAQTRLRNRFGTAVEIFQGIPRTTDVGRRNRPQTGNRD